MRVDARGATVLGVLTLALGGCWSAAVATETRSVGPDKPLAPGEGGPPGAVISERWTDPDPGRLPEPTYTPEPTLREALPGGLVAVVRGAEVLAPGDGAALLRLTVPAGADGANPGTALLAAHALADAPTGESNGPALRSVIEGLGGTVEVRVGARSTVLDIAVPPRRWRDALEAMVGILLDPPANDAAIEQARGRLLESVRRDLAAPQIESVVAQLAAGGMSDARQVVDGLEDRQPAEAAEFAAHAFRAGGAVLSLWLPGIAADEALEITRTTVQPWTSLPAEPVEETGPPPRPVMPTGLFWASHDDATIEQLALVVRAPHLTEPLAVETLVLLECLTMGGVGGRLAANAPPGVSLRARALHDGTTRYLVLHADAPAETAGPLWDAWLRARDDLVRSTPRSAEVRAAAARVRLRLLDERADPRRWLESASNRGRADAEDITLDTALRRLESPSSLDLSIASAALAGIPAALVGLGAEMPEDETLPFTELSGAFVGTGRSGVPTEPRAQIAAAADLLLEAVAAIGEQKLLRELGGMSAQRHIETAGGVTTTDRMWVLPGTGMRRIRQILATTIETVITPPTQLERAGADAIQLEQTEAEDLLAEAMHHPLFLLRMWLQQKVRFRMVSLRTVGDREFAVLQNIDPKVHVVRLHIDAGSKLVRAVETWRTDGQGEGVITTWSDYRTLQGLRCPHFSTTRRGANPDSLSVTWLAVALRAPEAPALTPGGPMDL